MIFPLIGDKNRKNFNSQYHIENMPVAVPNSFYRDYDVHNYRYDNNITEKETSLYTLKLEQKVRRLENINNIFLNILRENSFYRRNMNRNLSSDNLTSGSYPYLSFDKNRNRHLVYLNKDQINNNNILDGNYKDKYLVPILPKYNSVIENNRINYLLNSEKLKYCKNDAPYFIYNNNLNIPQKINSVQYFNKKIDYKKFNSNDKINNFNINANNTNSKEDTKILITNNNNNPDIRNEINRLNNNLNERLNRIENFQKSQKKDIDYLMGKNSKGKSKSDKSEKKDNNDKKENNNNNKKDNNNNKKESEESDSDSDDSESDEDDDDDDDEEKEIDIKNITSD